MEEKRTLAQKLWFGASAVQNMALFFLLSGVTLLVFIQVILRYVLHAPLMGIEELLLFPIVWLYMLGGASASWERTHITCGVLTLYIKRPRSIALFNTIKGAISIVVSCWLLYWSFWYFRYALRVWKESATLYIPLFYAESAIFIGLLLMTIYTGVELADEVKKLSRANNQPT